MSKSQKAQLDRDMANELELERSPFVLTIKHILKLSPSVGGFCFAYRHNDQLYYDTVPVQTSNGGIVVKPARFMLPEVVQRRLQEKSFYTRWYFYDTRYLYPIQKSKVGTLYDAFWMVLDSNPHYRSSVVCDPGHMQLRKKPLVAMRDNPVTWDDVTPQPPKVIVKRSKSSRQALALA